MTLNEESNSMKLECIFTRRVVAKGFIYRFSELYVVKTFLDGKHLIINQISEKWEIGKTK